MKTLFCLFMATALAVGSAAAGPCPEPFAELGLRDLSASTVQLDCSQKVLVVNLWATWCAPCRLEIPYLRDIYTQFEGQGVSVVGISLDAMRLQKLRSFVESNNITYPVYLGAAEEVLARLQVVAVPATIFVDAAGVIRKRLVGLHSRDEMRAIIVELLRENKEKKE